MKTDKLPNWNSIIYGKEEKVVCLVNEFTISGISLERWSSVYNIDKCIERITGSQIPPPKEYNFLFQEKAHFVYVDFICNKVDLFKENAEIFLLDSVYFSNLKPLIEFLEDKEINLESFELAWKQEYPL